MGCLGSSCVHRYGWGRAESERVAEPIPPDECYQSLAAIFSTAPQVEACWPMKSIAVLAGS